MNRVLLGLVATLAVLSSNSAAPTDSPGLNLQLPLPQLPTLGAPSEIDEHARAQARSVLGDALSQYPGLVDAVAGLLKTQQALTSTNPLQSLNLPNLQALGLPSLPNLQQPALDVAGLSRALPGLEGLPLPGLSGGSQLPGIPTTTLAPLIEGFLGSLRTIATSPMLLSPIRLAPPGGVPTVNAPIESRALNPVLANLPPLMVPFIVTLPNEQGLPPNEVVENFKQRVRDQMPPGSSGDGDVQATVSLGPLMNVIDAKPFLPDAPPAASSKPGASKEPIRTSVPGGLFGGTTDVQITLRRMLEQQQDLRNALQDSQRALVPVASRDTDSYA